MASSILVPHNTFPREQKGRKKDKEIWGWVSKGAKAQERKKKKGGTGFHSKGYLRSLRALLLEPPPIYERKQESCFFNLKLKLESI